ncbi:MAG TPA: hypothetical protein VKQ27_05490 [Acetobacteraceae bacterium]|nr:hypothetical protein [Acetobacteraceae bacterium]
MPSSIRRDTSLPGVAALTLEDFEAHGRGEITLGALADRLGVSRQAVRAAFKRRGWTSSGVSSADEAPPPLPGATVKVEAAPLAVESEPADAVELKERIGAELVQADVLLLGIIGRQLRHWHDTGTALGASQMKAAAAALSGIRENLIQAGLVTPAEDAERPIELRVRSLSVEEEAEIRRAAEADDGEQSDGEEGQEAERAGGDDDAPPAPSALLAAPLSPPVSARFIIDPVPVEAANFPVWLQRLALTRGARTLRQIIDALGGDPPAAGSGADLVTTILNLTAGDPARLSHLRK